MRIGVREVTEADKPFVYKSWLRSYRDGSNQAKEIPRDTYFSNHRDLVSKLLEEDETLIAYNPEHPDQIFGYLCFSPQSTKTQAIVHFVYVKSSFRQLGIASKLLRIMREALGNPKAKVVLTHKTGNSKFLKDASYNPYLLMGADYASNRDSSYGSSPSNTSGQLDRGAFSKHTQPLPHQPRVSNGDARPNAG